MSTIKNQEANRAAWKEVCEKAAAKLKQEREARWADATILDVAFDCESAADTDMLLPDCLRRIMLAWAYLSPETRHAIEALAAADPQTDIDPVAQLALLDREREELEVSWGQRES